MSNTDLFQSEKLSDLIIKWNEAQKHRTNNNNNEVGASSMLKQF